MGLDQMVDKIDNRMHSPASAFSQEKNTGNKPRTSFKNMQSEDTNVKDKIGGEDHSLIN